MPERLNRIQIDVDGTIVELPWNVRDELLVRAKDVRSMGGVRAKIEGVGASRPAVLDDAAEMLAVRDLVTVWERDPAQAPDEVRQLRNAIDAALERKHREAQGDA